MSTVIFMNWIVRCSDGEIKGNDLVDSDITILVLNYNKW